MEARLTKWGNSQGIRLSREILNRINIDGDAVFDISIRDNSIVLTPKETEFQNVYDMNSAEFEEACNRAIQRRKPFTVHEYYTLLDEERNCIRKIYLDGREEIISLG